MNAAIESTTVNAPAESTHPSPALGGLGKNWGWFLALGIGFVILGMVGIGMSTFLTITTVIFFGVILSAGGALQLIEAFWCRGWKSITFHILIGLLYLLGGIAMITNPLAGSFVLTVLIGSSIVVAGIARMVMGFQMKGIKGWGWVVFSAIVSLILGVLILAQLPSSALWLVGLFVAIELLMHGWSYIMLALAAKSLRSAMKEAKLEA